MKKIMSINIFSALTVFSFLTITQSAFANTQQDSILKEIADFSERICNEVPLTGTSNNRELKGSIEVQLNSFFNKFINTSATASIKNQNQEFYGLRQQDLIKALQNNTECKVRMVEILTNWKQTKLGNAEPTTNNSKINLNNTDYWYKQGYSYFYDLNNLKLALHAFNKCLVIDPNEAPCWQFKGEILYQLKRYEEAIDAADHAIAINPKHVYSWETRGRILSKLGRHKESKEAWAKSEDLTDREMHPEKYPSPLKVIPFSELPEEVKRELKRSESFK